MSIYLSHYSPMVDAQTEAASIQNQKAFDDAVSHAVANGVEDIILPPGTLWFKADGGTSTGLNIKIPNGKRIRFIGTSGAVIKRLSAQTMAPTSALVFMVANEGIEIEWRGVVFDGNEVNCELDPGSEYSEEQSANIKWLAGSGEPNLIRFHECDVGRHRVGDGYHANVCVRHFLASDCVTGEDAVRRTRADWQFSRYARYATQMVNIQCNSLESEPSETPDTASLMLDNVYARAVFDLAGDNTGNVRNPIQAQLNNVRCDAMEGRAGLPIVNFFRVHGTAVNCRFRGIKRIQRCKVDFIGGQMTDREQADIQARQSR